jgi:uncharacterized protein (DUF2062 family)
MRWIRDRLPSREALERNRYLKPFAATIASPLVWRFNRRGVARGVALGLFSAFAVPVAQTPFAAAFALGARANLPVAALSTFVTNPLTVPPLYLLAYQVGKSVLSFRATVDAALGAEDNRIDSLVSQFLETVGATYIGLLLFAMLSAGLGYAITHLAWRFAVSRRWARRQDRRHQLLESS